MQEEKDGAPERAVLLRLTGSWFVGRAHKKSRVGRTPLRSRSVYAHVERQNNLRAAEVDGRRIVDEAAEGRAPEVNDNQLRRSKAAPQKLARFPQNEKPKKSLGGDCGHAPDLAVDIERSRCHSSSGMPSLSCAFAQADPLAHMRAAQGSPAAGASGCGSVRSTTGVRLSNRRTQDAAGRKAGRELLTFPTSQPTARPSMTGVACCIARQFAARACCPPLNSVGGLSHEGMLLRPAISAKARQLGQKPQFVPLNKEGTKAATLSERPGRTRSQLQHLLRSNSRQRSAASRNLAARPELLKSLRTAKHHPHVVLAFPAACEPRRGRASCRCLCSLR